jgi:agmatine/peptidylarginine deiminase
MPEKGVKKNAPLWRAYSATVQLQEWIDKFTRQFELIEVHYPQPDGRVNVHSLRQYIKNAKKLIKEFDDISDEFAESMKKYVPSKEIDYFLKSKVILRKKLIECITKDINKLIK